MQHTRGGEHLGAEVSVVNNSTQGDCGMKIEGFLPYIVGFLEDQRTGNLEKEYRREVWDAY